MRYHAYKIQLAGTTLEILGDTHLICSIDLLTCLPRGGLFKTLEQIQGIRGLHEGAQSALSRTLDELLTPAFDPDDEGVRTGEFRLQLDHWNKDVANAFHRDASRYYQ